MLFAGGRGGGGWVVGGCPLVAAVQRAPVQQCMAGGGRGQSLPAWPAFVALPHCCTPLLPLLHLLPPPPPPALACLPCPAPQANFASCRTVTPPAATVSCWTTTAVPLRPPRSTCPSCASCLLPTSLASPWRQWQWGTASWTGSTSSAPAGGERWCRLHSQIFLHMCLLIPATHGRKPCTPPCQGSWTQLSPFVRHVAGRSHRQPPHRRSRPGYLLWHRVKQHAAGG